jgi:nitrate/nitrite-specific signal transduction histidine kinase
MGAALSDAINNQFTGKIDRKLSIVFVSLFLLVLVVGGSSFYLLRSHLLKSDVISEQGQQVEFVEELGSRLQAFTAEIQMAQLQGRAIPDSLVKNSLADFEKLLNLYEKSGGTRKNIQEMRGIIADAERVTARIASRMRSGQRNVASEVNIRDLAIMEEIQHRIQVFSDRIDIEHESIEDQLVSETRRKMQMTMAFNVALILLGTLFLLASKRYFHRAVVLPVCQLAERASEIAKGDLSKTVPVTSNDEIGLLSHAFNLMAEQLKEYQEELKGVAILKERERLAAELHDSLAQDLAFLRLKLIEAEESLQDNAHPETQRLVKELFQIVDEAYRDLRESIFGLRSFGLKNHVGFIAALTEYLHDFSEVRRIPVELQVADPAATSFSPQVETQLVRILHEALINIVKHARATKGKIIIKKADDNATISIEDDGEGFLSDTTAANGLHFGLSTMKDRAESVGGKLIIANAPHKGVRVTIVLPLAPQPINETDAPAVG